MGQRKSTWLLLFALVSAAGAVAPLPAHADVKLVSCSSTPGGEEGFRFRIDYGRSVVMWPGAAEETPAQISSESVVWERQRYEPGGGTVIVGARYVLDRMNGQLRTENYCLDRDWDWCSPSGGFSYCKPIEDKPLL